MGAVSAGFDGWWPRQQQRGLRQKRIPQQALQGQQQVQRLLKPKLKQAQCWRQEQRLAFQMRNLQQQVLQAQVPQLRVQPVEVEAAGVAVVVAAGLPNEKPPVGGAAAGFASALDVAAGVVEVAELPKENPPRAGFAGAAAEVAGVAEEASLPKEKPPDAGAAAGAAGAGEAVDVAVDV